MIKELEDEETKKTPSEKRKETMDSNLKIQNIMSVLRSVYTPEQKSDIQIMNAINKILNIKANRGKSEFELSIMAKELLDGKEAKKTKKNARPDMKMMRNAITG